MSLSDNVPCQKPELCGVKSHRPGTLAACMTLKRAKGSGAGATSKLAAMPSLATNKYDSSEEALGVRTEEVLEQVLAGTTVDILMAGSEDEGVGIRRFLQLNPTGEAGNMFASVDSAVTARIETKEGLVVYATDFGAIKSFTFKDGGKRTGYVHPTDADGEDISSQITTQEYDHLAYADKMAMAVGFRESLDPRGELSDDQLNWYAVQQTVSIERPDNTPFLNEVGEAHLSDALLGGKGQIVLETTADGIEKSILLNEYGNQLEDLYWITENPLRAKIKTASGVESFGTLDMRKEYTFKDGVTVEGWVRPNDEAGHDNSKDITSAEYEELRQLAGLAKTLGDKDRVDRNGTMGVFNRNREVVRRVMDQVKE